MKFGILEPSAALLQAIRTALTGAGDEVLWAVSEGDEALKLAGRAPPDAVLVGVRALKASGAGLVGALRRPVVVVSAPADRDVSTVYEAMSQGAALAADFPYPGLDPAALTTFVRQIRRVAPRAPATALPPPVPAGRMLPFLVALGASTGGPAALCEVLRGIGPGLPVPILIVQHIEPSYMPNLGEQLRRDGGIPVDLSSRGLVAAPGRVLLAATTEHLVHAGDGRFSHRPPAPTDIHHPSVDALFASLAGGTSAGVAALLTGMGRDGAAGLLELRRAGWFTIAQDEGSSVVHGMPKAAAAIGAAQAVLPLSAIGAEIRRRVAARGTERR
jgi:chemotaxis response regulator CheB